MKRIRQHGEGQVPIVVDTAYLYFGTCRPMKRREGKHLADTTRDTGPSWKSPVGFAMNDPVGFVDADSLREEVAAGRFVRNGVVRR